MGQVLFSPGYRDKLHAGPSRKDDYMIMNILWDRKFFRYRNIPIQPCIDFLVIYFQLRYKFIIRNMPEFFDANDFQISLISGDPLPSGNIYPAHIITGIKY